MHQYIVAYDIFDPKRLRKVAKIVKEYSMQAQKSSWESVLNKRLLKELIVELNSTAECEDKINIIKITSKPILLGKAKQANITNGGVVII